MTMRTPGYRGRSLRLWVFGSLGLLVSRLSDLFLFPAPAKNKKRNKIVKSRGFPFSLHALLLFFSTPASTEGLVCVCVCVCP